MSSEVLLHYRDSQTTQLQNAALDPPDPLETDQQNSHCIRISRLVIEHFSSFAIQFYHVAETTVQGLSILGENSMRGWVALCNRAKFPEQEQSPIWEDHFSWEEITILANKCLGLRHVTGFDALLHEKEFGVSHGCSLCLSPQSLCQSLDKEWEDLTEDNRETFIQQFESGIEEFVLDSIRMDLNLQGLFERPSIQLEQVLQAVYDNCHFSLIDYASSFRLRDHQDLANTPRDHLSWGNGLGRYPKAHIEPSAISLLSNIYRDDMEYSAEERETWYLSPETRDDWEDLCNRAAILVRNSLISAIREKFCAETE